MSFVFAIAALGAWISGVGAFSLKQDSLGVGMTFVAILIGYVAGVAS